MFGKKMFGKKMLVLLVSIIILSLAVTSTFAYSIPLSWVRNATGSPLDQDGDGIVDKAELIPSRNVGSGLYISGSNLRAGEGHGVIVGDKISLDWSYLKRRWFNRSMESVENETHDGVLTIQPEERYSKTLISNNDTYRNGSDVYNFGENLSYSPVYLDTAEIIEEETGTTLTEGLNYTLDYCEGKVTLLDFNTTVGDTEDIRIEYNYPSPYLNGDKTDGIFRTEHHPILKGTVSLTSGETQLEEGKCKDYTVLNYRTGKIKLWRFNRTKGLESVNVSYNWTTIGDEVFWNSTTNSLEVNEDELREVTGGVLTSGDRMTGDLNMSGNAITDLGAINLGSQVLNVNKTLNLSSNYILNSPSISGVSTQGLISYWPFEGSSGNSVLGWSKYSQRGRALAGKDVSLDLVEGRVGKALNLSKSGMYVPNKKINPREEVTLEMWVKFS